MKLSWVISDLDEIENLPDKLIVSFNMNDYR